MNVDHILDTLNRQGVAYLLIGGMNFLLRHKPVLTFDVDVWIQDTPENRRRCERALAALDAEWGATDQDWGPVAKQSAGWLDRQSVFCLLSPHGAIDMFRVVKGLDDWEASWRRRADGHTASGIAYHGLSDEDMLRRQYALDERSRRRRRCHVGGGHQAKRRPAMTDEVKRAEEARRWRCWDARRRWKAIQATITWAEAQATVRRNTREARLAEQRRKLADQSRVAR